MTRTVHDRFAKQYLTELLAPLGEVETNREVFGEVRQIDVWFVPKPQPTTDPQTLGLLGQFASNACLLEPFRNAPTLTEIRNCMLKLFELHGELQRKARRDSERIQEASLPRLWILSPSASATLLDEFGAVVEQQNTWTEGIYFLPPALRTAVVAINQLPRTDETLWVRILGKGVTQQQAIDELMTLPKENPLRSNALELLANWRFNLQTSENLDEEDEELIMNLSPAYLQWREETFREGVQAERRATIENLLRVRFGSLDDELSAIITQLLELPPEEFTRLLLQSSREELLNRFER